MPLPSRHMRRKNSKDQRTRGRCSPRERNHAHTYSEAVWVQFKFYGGIGLMLIFVVAQALLLARHVEGKGPE